MRVKAWRYTAWIKFNGTLNRGIWPSTPGARPQEVAVHGIHERASRAYIADELYSHAGDDGTGVNAMDAWENANVADDPANAATRGALFALLKAEFETPPLKPVTSS